MITPENYELIKGYVSYFSMTMPDLMRFQEKEDLAQDVVVKFIRHNHIEKFDPKRTSIKYHIMLGVKTTLIDILRKEKYRRLEFELDRPIAGTEENITLLDVTPGQKDDPQDVLYLLDLLKDLKSRCKEWGNRVDVPMLGEVKVSAYSVYMLFLFGYNKGEIGKIFGFTGARAGQLVRQAEGFLCDMGIRQPTLNL